MKNYKHVLLVMEKHDYPEDARKKIIEVEEKIIANEKANKLYDSIHRLYWGKKKNFDYFDDKTKELAQLIDEPVFTVQFIVVLNATRPLLAEYKKQGISEDIYWQSVLDLKSKLLECKEYYDYWGTSVAGWFMGFFTMTRFALGRFQYEFSDFHVDYYNEHGVEIKDSEFVLTMHIPSHQPSLTDDVRMDSYKKAFEFFKDRFGGKRIIVTCGSWLMYPDNINILPENSMTSEFILDFQPLDITQSYDFGDGWRVFGNQAGKPAAELPRNTTMQRAFAEWFLAGKKCGRGYALMIFDGEKVLTRNDRAEYREKYCRY